MGLPFSRHLLPQTGLPVIFGVACYVSVFNYNMVVMLGFYTFLFMFCVLSFCFQSLKIAVSYLPLIALLLLRTVVPCYITLSFFPLSCHTRSCSVLS